ncbi:unnamed protein product [Alternaria alternata]
MRLLHHDQGGGLVLTRFDDYEQPTYTILSHTWGNDEEEVSFADLMNGGGKDKLGYNKVRLCGEQTRRDGFQYFWVDTCCIDKSDKAELSLAIRSMFRWYQDATKCYVYLSDVSAKKRKLDKMLADTTSEHPITSSRWFKRGWTLQELLAPSSVEIFSREWERLGDKTSLGSLISRITGIPQGVLQGDTLAQFDISERLRWRGDRQTKLKEDMAYSLSGICDVDIAPLYGEGEEEAFRRLHREIQKLKDCLRDLRHGDPKDDKKRIEETKGGLLADSYCWVLDNATFQQWQRDPQRQLLWVKGDPGKGKTMLLCGIINELGRSMPRTSLLSYFFCQATFSHLNSATAVLRGLLYMLIDQQPLLVSHIYKRYDLAGKHLFEDANAWIALTEIWIDVLRDPGLRMGYFFIDGLDECTFDRSKLLRFIAMQSSSSSRLKWIVSSRNWPEIERSLEPAADKVLLSLELNARSISAAVKTFIDKKVSRLAEEGRYDEQIRNVISNHLSANAKDTFLWVALVCQHLEGTAKRHVMKKLKSIPLGLESFYERMMSGISESEDAETCRCVLATTAILCRPVVIQELIVIVEPLEESFDHPETVREIIQLCGSFLIMEEDTVYFVHQSAQDFLLGDAKDKIFPNGVDMAHQEIFRRSLVVLSSQLHRDMYKLEALDASVDTSRPPSPDPLKSLRYPCVHWIDHLCKSKSTFWVSHAERHQIIDEVMLFLKGRYLYWLESLSLCKSTTKGLLALKALSFLVKEISDAQDLIELVKDAHRFFVRSIDAIEIHPLQTYASALLFSPNGSLIKAAFQHEEPNWITIQPEIRATWGSCLHTFEHPCHAVAFSQNSNYLALSHQYFGIVIWDLESNDFFPPRLEGYEHLDASYVRFFDDSARLAAISPSLKVVKVWDVASGTCLSRRNFDQEMFHRKVRFCNDAELQAFAKATIGDSVRIFDTAEARELSILTSPHHDSRGELNSTFSPSGRLLAVNFETNIKVWDATSNRHIQSLEWPMCNEDSDPTFVASASVSDSALVAVGLSNHTVIVFSVNSGDILHILQSGAESFPGQAWTVAISYDSRKVALATGTSSLKIWDLSNTLNPRTLVVGDSAIRSVAFSPDSERLVSGSITGEIKIWDMWSEHYSETPDDHREDISSLNFSNDSSYLASGAFDSTVKIWDLRGRCLQTLHGHSRSIKRVDFFHHPACVGSLSRDCTYRVWDVISGKCLHVYQCGDLEMAVALSPDLGILAHTKGNRTTNDWPIQLWDIVDDVSLLTLGDDRASRIYSFAFSSDSTQLAVLVNENSVRIFHTGSGECLEKLDGRYETSGMSRYSLLHGHHSVTFSNDATRLASAWSDGTIRVWDRNSGRCLRTIETSPILSNILFDQSGQFVLTDRGCVAIPESPDLGGCMAALNTRSPAVHGGGLSLDRKWISYNSVNVLWLPPEYRPYQSVISGNSVGVATNRKVWIFTLSPEHLQ